MTDMIKRFKDVALVVLIILGFALFKDWQLKKSELTRVKENARQELISDSTKFVSQIKTLDEVKDYLEYQNKELKNKLNEAKIKPNKIQTIVHTEYKYKDTIINVIKEVIVPKKNFAKRFADSSKCLIVKGFIEYKNDSISVKITNRVFKNNIDAVAYWERKEWKFLFIKSRFLGKKQLTARVFNECGESKVIKIEK